MIITIDNLVVLIFMIILGKAMELLISFFFSKFDEVNEIQGDVWLFHRPR